MYYSRMNKQFSVLMITSETAPFAKSGGLGEVVPALAKQLTGRGHDVRIVMPRYYFIDKTELEPLDGALGIPVGFGEEWAGIYRTNLPGSDVPVYFIDHEHLFGRNGIYGPSAAEEYPDNPRRFTLLCRGAFQLCKKLEWVPDVMHAHDWPAALVPVYLYTWERSSQFTATTGILTIHNLGYQGIFQKNEIHTTQLEWQNYHTSGFEFHEQLNFLQAGIKNADIITTVSPNYAKEIQTPEYGFEMDGILRHRRGDLFGILNGIDYEQWTPETDPYIRYNYSDTALANKKKVKKLLQEEFKLPAKEKVPLIGMVSRLADQKGIGSLCGPTYGMLYNMCKDMELQFAILGSGETWCEEELKRLERKLPNLSVFIGFDNQKAHLVEGGSDFFLMPSKYEPCGLNQMYSLRYGTLPIARRTGGLADTIENYSRETGEGTGFLFADLTPRSIYDSVGWAVWTYYNRPDDIVKMRKRGMKLRFTWEKSAAGYEDLYQWGLDRRLGRFPRSW